MEYRIKDGKCEIPISEVNRLNDEWKAIEDTQHEFDKKYSDFQRDGKSGMFMTTVKNKEAYLDTNWNYRTRKYTMYELSTDAQEILKSLVDKEIRRLNNKFRYMTIKKFKAFKKGENK